MSYDLASTSRVAPTIFRVRRKRIADPHEALLVSLKRARFTPDTPIEPILCQLTSASDLQEKNLVGLQAAAINVIDIDPEQAVARSHESGCSNLDTMNVDNEAVDDAVDDNPLVVLRNAVEDDSSRLVVGEQTIRGSEVTLNGVRLISLSILNENEEEFVFDFYWSSRAAGCTADQIKEIRLAKADELLLNDGDDTESSVCDDDEDDSNDESNWRNEYPDESEHSSGRGSDDDTSSNMFEDECNDLERQLSGFDFCGAENSEFSEDDYE